MASVPVDIFGILFLDAAEEQARDLSRREVHFLPFHWKMIQPFLSNNESAVTARLGSHEVVQVAGGRMERWFLDTLVWMEG